MHLLLHRYGSKENELHSYVDFKLQKKMKVIQLRQTSVVSPTAMIPLFDATVLHGNGHGKLSYSGEHEC